jgi:hypothetical protein
MSEERAQYLGETPQDHIYEIRDEATPRDFFSQIPNLVDIMELSPYAYRLYGHLRKVAGESGRCWQSTKTLAKACDMSMGKVSASKVELENVYPPLIRVESKSFDRGQYHEIAITDIWDINHGFWTGEKITVKTAKGAVFHNMNEWRSQYESLRSPHEMKKNPVKEEPNNGGKPPTKELPIEWQIAGCFAHVVQPDEELAKRLDFANWVGVGTSNPLVAREIAMAFQTHRNMTLPKSKAKGQRKAVKEMLDMGVKAAHVKQAVDKLTKAGMTVTDLFSVVRTAIDLANKPEEKIEYYKEL